MGVGATVGPIPIDEGGSNRLLGGPSTLHRIDMFLYYHHYITQTKHLKGRSGLSLRPVSPVFKAPDLPRARCDFGRVVEV